MLAVGSDDTSVPTESKTQIYQLNEYSEGVNRFGNLMCFFIFIFLQTEQNFRFTCIIYPQAVVRLL